MSGLPMMPWWPRDFLAATIEWALLERGLYHCLLDAQWELGSLPTSEADLARIVRATPEEFEAAWPRVKTKFVPNGNGRLINEKLEEHRAVATEKHRRRVEAGRRGGTQQNKSNATSNTQAKGEAKSKHPSPSPSPAKNMENVDSDYKKIDNLNHEAWEMWQAHRRKTKLRKYTTLMKARELAVLPEPMQMECVKFSISNQYHGLFPNRFTGGTDRKPTYAQELKADIDATKH